MVGLFGRMRDHRERDRQACGRFRTNPLSPVQIQGRVLLVALDDCLDAVTRQIDFERMTKAAPLDFLAQVLKVFHEVSTPDTIKFIAVACAEHGQARSTCMSRLLLTPDNQGSPGSTDDQRSVSPHSPLPCCNGTCAFGP